MLRILPNSILRFLLSALMLCGSTALYALEKPTELETTPITAESSIEEIRAELQKMNIPVLDFVMENGKFPNCDYIEAPEGCNGFSITNNEYVQGKFTISIGNEVIYESGEYVNKESGVRLKIRGNTSSYDGIKKKSYKVKLSKKADLLNRGDKNLKDKDWVLLGMGSKKLNYVVGTETARICGIPWEPAGRHVVVIMNDQYMGTYYLIEAVSAGSHRVDIEDSGYIVENDSYWWKPDEVFFKSNHQKRYLGWTFKEPDTDDFHEMSLENIKWAINTVEHRLFNGEDVTDIIDFSSFVNWLLSHDILMTRDGYGSNIFVKKKDFDFMQPFSSKFEMGPLWDFDNSLEENTKSHTTIYSLSGFWYHLITKDPLFQDLYMEKWKEVRETLKEELCSRLEKYLRENPDIYKARLIDFNRGLISDSEIEHPVDDYNYLSKWIDDRIPILNSLILGEESDVEDIVSPPVEAQDTSRANSYYNIGGIKTEPSEKGFIIRTSTNGKSSKIINH